VSVGLGCVAIVVIALWILAGYAGSHSSATSGDRQVRAAVRTTASCQGTDTNDTVTFVLDGQTHQAKLDGCGHQAGETVDVLVPAGFNGDTVLEPADAAPGDSSGLSHRVAFLLLVLATAIGGVCGYQIFRIRNRTPRERPPGPTGRSIRETGPMKFGPPIKDDLPDRAADAGRTAASNNGNGSSRRSRGLGSGRLAARFRSSAADRDEVYPGESRAPSPHDPEATGVDWFEDSSAHMRPVDRPHASG
jgi:hypothetical protein